MGYFRLAAVVAAVWIAWMAWGERAVSPRWLVAPAVIFFAMIAYHEAVLRRRTRAARAAGFYDLGLAKVEHRWMGAGEMGERFRVAAHPYAEDLDLFGHGSLFERINTARLRTGEDALAGWMMAPAEPAEAKARQEAVVELAPLIDLREELFLLGDAVRAGVHPEPLAAWGEAPRRLDSVPWRTAAFALPVLLAAAMAPGVRELAIAAALVQCGFALWLRPRVTASIAASQQPCQDLLLLSRLLEKIERERFASARLQAIQEKLKHGGDPPSRRIAKLAALIDRLDWRRNAMFAIIAAPLLWATHCAFGIEAWRKKSGGDLRSWLEAAGEFEALASMAAYAFENPSDALPEFVAEGPVLVLEAASHPLLEADRAISNSVTLERGAPLKIVSGSNMSGKSTLLRTVGVNAVLAQMGAPVRAARMRMSPLAVGASIRVTDSLEGGVSRFFAEITRLRLLVEMASGPRPLLFLLDELLNGTNSADRRKGAAGILDGLVRRGAIGLVTTHDLAITEIAATLNPPGTNIHFEDHLEDGRMTFDYRIRQGVVEKSNAIELMRSIGLEV